MAHYGGLEILWFGLIVALWIGYFVLEGFDFGVGMLVRAVGRDRTERRVLMHTIGPVWDGNEVWLIVAGGATFAAFPEWYATLFSGFYLPLLLIVLALVLRPVALEFWGKDDRPRWRSGCEWALVVGSVLPAFLWGVAFANVVHGVPVNADKELTGSALDLFGPYAVLGGLTTLLLCASHGAAFLTLKTRDETLVRARRVATALAPASAVSTTAFVTWTLVHSSHLGQLGASPLALGVAAIAFAVASPVLGRLRAGWAFAANGATIALVVATLFVDLYPNVLVSSTSAAFDLTLGNAASGSYTLTVMTVVAAIFLPVVLSAQAWSYWIFRRRVGREDVGDVKTPADLPAEDRAAGAGDLLPVRVPPRPRP
jgi:cytochrome d ubiquinol oxidase subunit II